MPISAQSAATSQVRSRGTNAQNAVPNYQASRSWSANRAHDARAQWNRLSKDRARHQGRTYKPGAAMLHWIHDPDRTSQTPRATLGGRRKVRPVKNPVNPCALLGRSTRTISIPNHFIHKEIDRTILPHCHSYRPWVCLRRSNGRRARIHGSLRLAEANCHSQEEGK